MASYSVRVWHWPTPTSGWAINLRFVLDSTAVSGTRYIRIYNYCHNNLQYLNLKLNNYQLTAVHKLAVQVNDKHLFENASAMWFVMNIVNSSKLNQCDHHAVVVCLYVQSEDRSESFLYDQLLGVNLDRKQLRFRLPPHCEDFFERTDSVNNCNSLYSTCSCGV